MLLSSHVLRVLVCLSVCLSAVVAVAQKREKDGQNVRVEGTVQAVAPGFMKVMSEENQVWVAKIDTNKPGAYRVVGSATADWLRPGMLVRFRATFDRKGKVVQPVEQLTVFTPGKDDKPGLVSDQRLGGDINFLEDGDKKPEEPQTAMFQVTGQLRGLRNGALSVLAGRVPVQAQLADDAAISVDVADYRLARAGDKVELRGRPAGQGRMYAQWLKVLAAQPLGQQPPSPAGDKQQKSPADEK